MASDSSRLITSNAGHGGNPIPHVQVVNKRLISFRMFCRPLIRSSMFSIFASAIARTLAPFVDRCSRSLEEVRDFGECEPQLLAALYEANCSDRLRRI